MSYSYLNTGASLEACYLAIARHVTHFNFRQMSQQEAQGLYAELFSFVYFKCLSEILLYFYKCST